MPKLRLRSDHRQMLKEFARKVAKCPAEEQALEAAYNKAAPLVRKVVEAKYPLKDMRICKKYDVAEIDDCIKLQLAAGGIEMFNFARDTGPLVARSTSHGAIYAADDACTAAVADWITARDALKAAQKAKNTDYDALIFNARTLEDVTEVWPEADSLRPKMGSYALTVLSADAVERIKADVAMRANA